MGNTHRISWIDAQIRTGRYPNASSVAARFEISRRQAARDIEYLRYSMGAPIEYSAEHNGYRYVDEAYALPALVVSNPERSALVHLAERYGAMEGEAAARVAGVLRRLGARAVVEEDGSDATVPIDTGELDAVTALRRAIDARRVVSVRYRGPDGLSVQRTVWPYAVVPRFGQLCCVGYCEELGATHVFPLFRFERVEQTQAAYEVPPYVHPQEWARGSLPPQPFVATVRLEDASDAERLEGAHALDDGLCRIEFHDARSLISALMACPSGFEVLSPGWLRDRVIDRISSLHELHNRPVRARPRDHVSQRARGSTASR